MCVVGKLKNIHVEEKAFFSAFAAYMLSVMLVKFIYMMSLHPFSFRSHLKTVGDCMFSEKRNQISPIGISFQNDNEYTSNVMANLNFRMVVYKNTSEAAPSVIK